MSEWGFLIDENLERQTAAYLEAEGIRGEHVSAVLFHALRGKEVLDPYVE